MVSYSFIHSLSWGVVKHSLILVCFVPLACVYVDTRKEGNVLFNDALNTFNLRLYGVRHMVKDHSDSERGNPLRHIGYSFRLTARVMLILVTNP